MSLIIVEAIRGRCASFTSLPATVSEIGPIWWTDNPTYFSSIDVSRQRTVRTVISHSATSNMCECLERTRCLTPMGVDVTALSAGYGLLPSANVLSSSRPCEFEGLGISPMHSVTNSCMFPMTALY